MGILIMSDLVPPASGPNEYTEGQPEALLDAALLRRMEAAEWNVVNLECPLTEETVPVRKWGSCLRSCPESIALLRRIPNLVVNLANNHIRDYGDHGVLDTISLLEKYDIPYLGAGPCASQAHRTLMLPLSGSWKRRKAVPAPDAENRPAAGSGEWKGMGDAADAGRPLLGIFTAAEHEFSTAGLESAGAAALEEDDLNVIRELAARADYVIALYHGGEEFCPYPGPLMRGRLRAWAQAGADLIVCQHSHCIGSAEQAGSSTIVYGQGNFLFGERPEVEDNISDRRAWERGMLVEACPFDFAAEMMDLQDCAGGEMTLRSGPAETSGTGPALERGRNSAVGGSASVRYHFYHRENGILRPDADSAERKLFEERSRLLLEDGFLEKYWREYCLAHREFLEIFRKDLSGRPLPMKTRMRRGLYALLGKDPFPEREILRIQDYLSCESHRELLLTLLKMHLPSE